MILNEVLQGLRHFGAGPENRDKRNVKSQLSKI